VRPARKPRRIDDDLRLLVETVQDYAIFMLDPQGTILSWNVGAERLKGYTAQEAIGQRLSLFYTPEDAAAGKPQALLARAALEGRAESEGWRIRKDGSRFWANVIVTAVHESGGALRGYAKITRDLTERKRGEDSRLALAQAREAVRLRDEFLSIASHELRTPLNALHLFFEALSIAFGKNDPSVPAILDKAKKQLQRVFELVNRLLDATRVGKGTLHIDMRERVDLGQLIEDTVEELRAPAKDAGSEIAVSLPGQVEGTFDPMLVQEMVRNLIGNAVKYGAGRSIEVALTTDDRPSAVINVADHGIGIEAHDMERIFDPFQRAADRLYGGLGLGLYLTRHIAEAHGGTVTVRSVPGEGSTFTITLPLQRRTES